MKHGEAQIRARVVVGGAATEALTATLKKTTIAVPLRGPATPPLPAHLPSTTPPTPHGSPPPIARQSSVGADPIPGRGGAWGGREKASRMNPKGHLTDQMSSNLGRHGLGPRLGSGAYTHRPETEIAVEQEYTMKRGRFTEAPRQSRMTALPFRFPSAGRTKDLVKKAEEALSGAEYSTAQHFEEQQREATEDTGSKAQFEMMAEAGMGSAACDRSRVLEHATRGIHVIDSSFDPETDTCSFTWPSAIVRDALCSEETLIMFAHRPSYEDGVLEQLQASKTLVPGMQIEALREDEEKRWTSEPLPHASVLVIDRDLYEVILLSHFLYASQCHVVQSLLLTIIIKC